MSSILEQQERVLEEQEHEKAEQEPGRTRCS